MTTQMIVRMDPLIKQRLNKLARREGKSTSQMVRELIEGYIQENDIGVYIDDLWDRIGGSLKSKEVQPRDINKTVKAVRKERQ